MFKNKENLGSISSLEKDPEVVVKSRSVKSSQNTQGKHLSWGIFLT